MTMVSMKTESIWTRPCFTGCDTEAEAAALGADPTPASLEYRPRLMPYIMAEPAKPPASVSKRKSKAPETIARNMVGMFW